MVRHSLLSILAAAALCSCNGIFGGIYDVPAEDSDFGFIEESDGTHTGKIYIDATSYTEWHYVDLHSKTVTSSAVGEPAPERWDFAIHRYDAKTNGGRVADSGCTDFQEASLRAETIADDVFENDLRTDDRIAIDMSRMIEGIILYAEDDYNPVLSRWLDVDISTMPPVYTLSHRIYLLKMPDGSAAALKLDNFMNTSAIKGFMTVEYLWPL